MSSGAHNFHDGPSLRDTRELHDAQTVARHLDSGGDTSRDQAVNAARVLMDQLGREGAQTDAGDVLAQDLWSIAQRGMSLGDRGRMLGQLVGVGSAAAGVLARLLDDARGDAFEGLLSLAERAALPAMAKLPLQERLAQLALWLEQSAESSPVHGNGDDNPLPPSAEIQESHAVVPRPQVRETELDDHAVAGASPDPDPKVVWNDASASPETKVQLALALGPSALPLLVKAAANPANREAAVSALIHLGRDPANSAAVRAEVSKMMMLDDTKTAGALVRDTLAGKEPPSGGAREHAEGGGWLQRSIDCCSPPAILMAAAGREKLALSLVGERLMTLRQNRAAALNASSHAADIPLST